MSESVSNPVNKSTGSFASLLESFTIPAKKANGAWDDTALLDDVATISYEQALRSHRRVPSVAAIPGVKLQSASAQVTPTAPSATNDRKRKTASITIRLTESEQTQLHERATEAQLSVSAYLRSCIFEAESLRAQVKEALATMRAIPAIEPQASSQERSASAERKRFHLFSRWSHRHTANS